MPKFSTIKHNIQRAPAQLAHKASHAGSRVKALASSALESIRHPFQRRDVTANVLVDIDSNDWTQGNDNPLFEPAKTKLHNKLFAEIKADRSNAEDDARCIEDPDKKPVRTIAFNRASLLDEIDTYFKDEDEPKAMVARPESRGQGVASASEMRRAEKVTVSAHPQMAAPAGQLLTQAERSAYVDGLIAVYGLGRA